MLILMARNGLVPLRLGSTSTQHRTPACGGVLAGVLAVVPVIFFLEHGATGAEVYGWMGSLAVVGYLTAYTLLAAAAVAHRRAQSRLHWRILALALCSVAAMVAVAIATLFPVPPAPFRNFPIYFLLFLTGTGIMHRARGFVIRSRQS